MWGRALRFDTQTGNPAPPKPRRRIASMAVNQIGRLSEEDLERYQQASALRTLAERAHPGLGVEEAVEAIVSYNKLMGEFISTYELEDFSTSIAVTDGSIVERF